jgi:membrane-associated phospholipid phosphatase
VQWDLGFLALTGGLIASDRRVSGSLPSDHLSVSRGISNVGLYATTVTLGGLWLTGEATHDPHAREAGTLGAEGLANAAAVYAAMQLAAGRQRPLEGDGGGHFGRNNALSSSFPSGHAIFTWTEAGIIAHEYPKPWVQWLAYGTATAVSVTRFTGKEHFPADVVVGSAFGYLIGRHIFHSRCQVGLSSACSARHRK